MIKSKVIGPALCGALCFILCLGQAGAGVVKSFEGQTVTHYTYDVAASPLDLGTMIEPVRLFATPVGGSPQLIATAPAAAPTRVTGSFRMTGLAADQRIEFTMTFKTVEQGSHSEPVGGDSRESGIIGGTPLFDESLSALPVKPPWISLTMPAGRHLKLAGVEVAGLINLDEGGGSLELEGVKAEGVVCAANTKIGTLAILNSVFLKGSYLSTAIDLSVESTFFGDGTSLNSAGSLDVKSSDFYAPPGGSSFSSIRARAEHFSLTNCVFVLPAVLGPTGGGKPAITGNSFLQGLSAQLGGISLPGNYWGGAKGPRSHALEWLDGQGGDPGGSNPAVSFLTTGKERATQHQVDVAASRIVGLQYKIAQNISGGALRKGRETLVSIDARTLHGTRSASDLRLKTGTALIPPVNNITIQRDYGPPVASAGNENRTVNFIIPPGDETVVDFDIIDTTAPAGFQQLVTHAAMVQREAPVRPLRLAVLPLAVDGYVRDFQLPRTGQYAAKTLRQQMAAMLPLRPDEIEIEVLPEARYKLGYSAMYVLASRGYMLNESSAVLLGHLSKLNAQRSLPFDFLIAVVPRGTLGTDALGVSLPFRREVIMVDEVSPESAIHEIGHALGLHTLVEQYSVLFDGYDDTGTYYKSGYGARVEACTAFIPSDTAALSPIRNRIRHFPYGEDSNVWDVMGGDGTQWITPSTHLELGNTLLSRLATGAAPLPTTRSAREAPPPGRRRVLMEGLLDPVPSPFFHLPILRESLHCGLAPAEMTSIRAGLAGGHEFHAYDASGVRVFNELCLVNSREGGRLQPWIQTFDVPEAAVRYEIMDQWTREIIFIQKALPGLGATLQPPAITADGTAVNLSWAVTGTLPSGRPLDIGLHVSSDGGNSWKFTGEYDEQSRVTLPLDLFPAGPLRFKVVASDGIGRAESASAPWQAPAPAAPAITISHPWNGAVAPPDSRWTFSAATAVIAAGQTADWHSSRDGALGSGFTVSGVLLSPGTHTVTVTVKTPGLPDAQRQIAVEVAEPGVIDLALETAALTFSTAALDPILGPLGHPVPGRPCRVNIRVHNPGVRHTAKLQIYLMPPGGGESLLSEETFTWDPLMERECFADFLPAAAGSYRVRAVVSHLGPDSYTEINPANNQQIWTTANTPPVGRGYDGTVREKRSLNLELSADDADGDAVQFTVVSQPAHGTLTGTAPNLTYRPDDGFSGKDSFLFRPADAFGEGANVTATLSVVPAPPVFLSPVKVIAEQYHPFSYTANYEGTGLEVSVSFPPVLPGLVWNPATRTVTGTVSRTGSFGLLFSIGNAAGRLEPNVVVEFLPNDDLSGLTSARTIEGTVGQAVSYTATGSFFPGSIEFSDLPPGVFDGGGGRLIGSPEKSGFFNIRVGLTNNAGKAWETVGLRVHSSQMPPGLPQNSAFGIIGQPMSWPIRAFHEPTLFKISGLPVGLTLDAATGIISGVPEQGGSLLVMVEASNLYGADSEIMGFSITVPAGYPVLTDPGAQFLTGGAPATIPLAASPGPVSYAASGLPDGLLLNPTSGLLSGSPSQAGTFTPIIRVSNAAGTTALRLQLTVNPGPGMPVITSSPVLNGVLGGTADFPISGTNNPALTVTGLPDGLTFNPSTRRITGLFRATGSRYLTVTASNAKGQSSLLMLLTVTPSYTGWISLQGLSGTAALATADPDMDGAVNQMEYLGSSDPRSATSRPRFTIESNGGFGVLRFRCLPVESGPVTGAFQAGGIACKLQRSFTLSGAGAWEIDPGQFGMGTITSNDDGTVEVALPLLGNQSVPSAFFRLSTLP